MMKFSSPQLNRFLKPVVEKPRHGDDEDTNVSASHSKEAGLSSEIQDDDTDSEGVSEDVQLGVKKIEATTSVWSTGHLILAYTL